jgi:hypothetical protein
MPMCDLTRSAHPAAATTQHRNASHTDVHRIGARLADRQLEHSARALAAVINASTKLQQLRNRAMALEYALARMKTRQADSAA